MYFNVKGPDIVISSDNLPKTYGKLGSVTCNNSTALYNQRYNRIEVSQMSGFNPSCTLNYTDSTSRVNLASYIVNLASSAPTQGNGKIVSETAETIDRASVTAIAQSAYTNQSAFSSTSASSTSGTTVSDMYTFSDNVWTSAPSSMTSGRYNHFKFTPSESGFYQLCYNLSSGGTNNYLYVMVGSSFIYFPSSQNLSPSSSEAKSGCMELGYVSTSNYIKVVQNAGTDIPTLSFSIKKYANKSATDYRYEGKDPNNYVWFNNEYWRIIGVFDSASHGQSGKNLVKIIREEVLDGLEWDISKKNSWTYSYNNWTTSSLNSLLNGAYYNAQDGTDSGYCYGYSTSVTGNCDYQKRGIQSGYRGMIANVTWYLGGYSSISATAEDFYGYERGTTVYEGSRPISTTGYIGLMYPSDYGYSVLSTSCARTTYLSSYSSSTCAGASWLYGKGYEWTLSPSSSYPSLVFYVVQNGSIGSYVFEYRNIGLISTGRDVSNTTYSFGFRPVLYLDSSVYRVDGDGTLDSPFIIGM